MRVIIVAGARPNFVKVAPLVRAFSGRGWQVSLVHTGQHYDDRLAHVFFADLGLPPPSHELAVGSGTHAVQTATVMTRFEPVLTEIQPHLVVVVGDVNSTLACALVASKFSLLRPFETTEGRFSRPLVAHVEAGLRSGDRDMPEEINRVLTDAASDLWFATEAAAVEHLVREGAERRRVHLVGNVMIDSLQAMRAVARTALPAGLPPAFGLVTLHRPSNVDDPAALRGLLAALEAGADGLPLVFPIHPRTASRLVDHGMTLDPSRWLPLPPQPYPAFLALQEAARLVCTDSGGVQEEACVLGTPCLTLRSSTERPVTLAHGNRLVGTEPAAITRAMRDLLATPRQAPQGPPPLWDGHAAERIADVVAALKIRDADA